MRTRNDPKRTFRYATVVKVHTDRNQCLQDFDWRLDEQGALFLGPTGKSGMLNTPSNRNAEVLMHGHQPVPASRFLEVGALHCNEIRRHSAGKTRVQTDLMRELTCPTFNEKRSGSRTHAGSYFARQCFALCIAQQRWHVGDAMSGKKLGIHAWCLT